jgi:hypothetical protein
VYWITDEILYSVDLQRGRPRQAEPQLPCPRTTADATLSPAVALPGRMPADGTANHRKRPMAAASESEIL